MSVLARMLPGSLTWPTVKMLDGSSNIVSTNTSTSMITSPAARDPKSTGDAVANVKSASNVTMLGADD